MVVDVGQEIPEGDDVGQDEVDGMRQAVEARMRQLGLTPTTFAHAAGVTVQGLDPVRAGVRKQYQAKTRIGVARALRWPEDWYDRLVAGEPANHFPDTRWPAAQLTLEERVAAVEARLDALIELVERAVD